MNYFAYHFTVDPVQPGSEILMAMISDMGFDSFDQTEKGFTAYVNEEEDRNVSLKDLSFEDFKFSFLKEKVEQKNWNEEWEKNFEPVRVDHLLLIRAPFHLPDPQCEKEIVIMPKMSFGTGHHQTTRLICKRMFSLALKEARVLDMGCGTGILAILAEKLGAGTVVAVDVDEWSVMNSVENCRMNDVHRVNVLLGGIEKIKDESPFGVIVANINKNVLVQQIPIYRQKMNPGATLLMSGFFTTDVDELKSAGESHGLQYVSCANEGEWAMLQFSKNK